MFIENEIEQLLRVIEKELSKSSTSSRTHTALSDEFRKSLTNLVDELRNNNFDNINSEISKLIEKEIFELTLEPNTRASIEMTNTIYYKIMGGYSQQFYAYAKRS